MTSRQTIAMPKLGLTMTEGVLAEWNVAPGDRVKAGDVIFVVETDKISNEIEAAEAGVVETLHVQPGDVVPVGEIVATFVVEGTGKEELAVSPPAPAIQDKIAAAPAALPSSAERGGRPVITPLARRMAATAGLEIGSIMGSGPGGRIMADDVTAAIQTGTETLSADSGKIRPLGLNQKVVARRLTEAKRDIPHFYIFAEADVTALLELRAQLNADPASVKLTISHFIITAIARALAMHPANNRVWTDEGLLELPRIDVGLAVEGPKGLVAPVLRDLGDCDVDEVAQAATHIVDSARAGRLSQSDLQGGATTLSNVGMFGATGLLPIINPGQSSILGVGRSKGLFRPDAHDQPRLRQILDLSLSCDHRVIDGAQAARFLQAIQENLEAPAKLLRRPLRGPSE